jgi:hypothetical protein
VQRRRLRAACVLVALLAGCHRGQVRLPVAEAGRRHQWRQRVEAEVLRAPYAELLYAVEAPAGYADALQNPLEGFVIRARKDWNHAVEPIGDALEELAERHNDEAVSVREYERRTGELLGAARQLRRTRTRLDAALENYRVYRRELMAARAGGGERPGQEARQAQDAMEGARQRAEELLAEAQRAVSAVAGRPDGEPESAQQ